MKKENKQMAQQRRAQQREKEARRRMVIRVLRFWGPIALAVVVVIVLVAAIAGSGADSGAKEGLDEDSEIALTLEEDDDVVPVLNTEEGTAVQDGDTVNIDFVGYVDGEEFEGGNTNGAGYDLEIGSGEFIDGFEEGIIGHTVGETFDLNLQFPDPYPNDPSLSGSDVTFTTTVNGIYE